MKTLVVFDSFFGNTEKIARAIAEGVTGEVEVRRVSETKPEDTAGWDFVVVGSPTRGFRPSPETAKFLKAIPQGYLNGTKVAAFDTRMDVKKVNNGFLTFMESIFGYAAEPIGKTLKKKGGTEALPPEGFFVLESEGPLAEGELERAEAWGRKLI